MNYNLKRELPLLLILLLQLIAAILIYPHMPDQVPIHWNASGEIDGYGSRVVGAFLFPALNAAAYFLFLFLPKIDPKRENYSKFGSSYLIIRYAIHFVFVFIFVLTALASLGYPLDISKWMAGGVAVLFIVLGNIMGRVRHNYFVGFKFPWTLANEEVWKKTHQVGAKVMVLGGVAALIGVIFTQGAVSFMILMIGILLPVLITTVYSYLLYRNIAR